MGAAGAGGVGFFTAGDGGCGDGDDDDDDDFKGLLLGFAKSRDRAQSADS